MTRSVFVTGATGFLGAFVAAELQRQTGDTVYCLVRGRSDIGGDQRLRDNLAKLHLRDVDMDRLRCIPGNMRKPDLGLNADAYQELAGEIDEIYHCAASVNLAAPYVRLAPTNVVGTHTMLALAKAAGATLHFVSSAAVFMDAHISGYAEVAENTPTTAEMAAPIGYAQTKFVAENLIRDSGIPFTIHRPGFILGDSTTGACSETDGMVRAIRAAVALGVAPDSNSQMPVAPIDFVAKAIVALSRRPGNIGQTFHLTQAEPLTMRDVFEFGRAAGYPMSWQSCADWEQALRDNLGNRDAYLMVALWDFSRYMLAVGERYRIGRINSDATLAQLSTLDIHSPPVNAASFARIYAHLAAVGLLRPSTLV